MSALFIGLLVAGFYFVNDPDVPTIYKVLTSLAVLGLLMYFFMRGGGGKGGPLGGEAPPDIWPGVD